MLTDGIHHHMMLQLAALVFYFSCPEHAPPARHAAQVTLNAESRFTLGGWHAFVPGLFINAAVVMVRICQVALSMPQLFLQQGNTLCGCCQLALLLLTLLLYCTCYMSIAGRTAAWCTLCEAWLQALMQPPSI